MRHFAALAARSIVLLLVTTSALAATLLPTGSSVPGEVLIKMRSGTSALEVRSVEELADADESTVIANTSDGVIRRVHSRSKSVPALVDTLDSNPNVEYVEPNYYVHVEASPNDPQYSSLWGLGNTGQVIQGTAGLAGSDVRAESAWNVTTGSASIVVGVVDTGIDYNHPDLAANVWSNPGGKGNAACAAGTHGFNAITGTCNPMDDYYHGTHVAGTIGAAGNNGAGVTGVNWTASIMGLKFLDASGYGTTAGAITAIDFAVQAKIDGVNVRVLSNSWGGGAFSKALLDEINKANEHDILFVASAGNNGSSTDTSPNYPSSYVAPNIIAVAALDNRDNLAYFSNYGLTTVHLGAPGVNVLSTMPGNNYGYLSGTSMAAPHVSGVAALVLAHSPSLTTAQVKSAILDNTDTVNSLIGKSVTGGRLNAARALGLPADPGFRVSISPTTKSVVRGESATYTVTINPVGGFAGTVDLSISGLPGDFTAGLNPVQTTTTSTLTVTTPSTPVNYYAPLPFTITGTSGALINTVTASVFVTAPPAQLPCPSFSAALNYYGYTQTSAGAAGDFNRDGVPDLALADPVQNRVTVMFGIGLPPTSSSSFSVGATPLSIATGDFNRDGRPDLVTANAGSNNVSVLLANSNGSFQSATNYAAGVSPFSVAVGDFNADGKSDLAVANNGSGNVSILLGAGNGTFQPAVPYSTGSGPFGVTVADFDGDGRQDLAVANFNAANVTILAGNGDGTFGSAASYATGNGSSSVAAADLNRDGKLDLAVSSYGGGDVSVLLGNGDRTFQAAVHYTAAGGTYSVAIADFNGDGTPDLATANNSGTASILLGTGAGTFLQGIQYPTYNEPNQLVVADFNRDGRMDFVTPGGGAFGYLVVQLNVGTCTANCGTFAPPADSIAGTTPDAAAAGDFDRDGDLDLAVANKDSNDVSILSGNGTASFSAGATVAAGTSPDSIVSGDFDADGLLDLAVANRGSNNVSLLRGKGDGTFYPAVHYGAGTGPRGIAAGDFNRDGKLDLAVANDGSNDVSILLGNGDATFQAAVSYAAGSHPAAVAAGDFDRDGKLDLAVANSGSDNASILTGNGDGTFQTQVTFNTGVAPLSIAVADLNRDGYADLAVANNSSNNVSILLGKDGGFQSAVAYAAGNSPTSVVARDFNLDGVPDLAIANSGTDSISILKGTGPGIFNAAVSAGTGDAPAALLAGDFNRDGTPDLVSANSGDSTVSVLLNTCPIPDLTITKTHSGNFAQGNTGRTYTITVTNSGTLPTTGTVTVTDTIPSGLVATAISGTGWTCTLATTTCTRTDALAAGSSYPVITLTVNVASNAAANVTNTVAVSGGGELNTLNSTASDVTSITPVMDLAMSLTHTASFTQGAVGRSYRLLVSDVGGNATAGTVTVTDSLPAGLTATAINGTGWTCTLAPLTCTRSDALAAYTSYPPITLTVNVAANAPSTVVNSATVSGGSDANPANNTALDQTTIWSSQTCGTFGAPAFYGSGSGNNLAVADFNNDGKQDVAVTSYNTVTIFLGNGNGTMTSGSSYGTGDNTSSIAVGDLNHDGNPDLVAASFYGGGVSVLLGTGDGTFQSGILYPAPSYLVSLALDDFDRDGNLDVAVGISASPGVAVLLGTGTGALRSAVTYPTGYTRAIGSADFNGDTYPDLVATSGSFGIYVLIGNGDGTFQSPAFSSGGYTSALAISDLNNDGKLDLALASSYASDSAVLLGNGNGTFQAPLVLLSPYGSSSVKADDIDGDGKIDLAFATSYNDTVAVMRGNGDGTFQPSDTTSMGSSMPQNLAISDFNGDGKADLAAPVYYSGKLAILMSACPDLTITKTHSGNAVGGQTNFLYTLKVSNSGGSSHGTVTVTDNLPAGLTATSLGGYGWTCTLATLTCTRSDSLSAASSYSEIGVTVNVLSTAPASVTNVATVSGGSDSNSANNSASDPTTIVQRPDLAIAMTHTGSFAQGDTGRTYTITVSNIGSIATSGGGNVMVTEIPLTGMAITGMTGAGWQCVLSQLYCTRTDSLGAGASYPPITLTASIGYGAFSDFNAANVASTTGDTNYANNYATDFTVILATPQVFFAYASTASQVQLVWNSVAYATRYEIYRSSNHGPFVFVAETPATELIDRGLTPGTTYVYRLRAGDSSTVTSFSYPDIATTITFTDGLLTSGVTPMKAVHINELRTAVNAVRVAAGLPVVSFAEAVTPGSPIKASHQTELRNLLDEARIVLGLPVVGYTTDPQLTPGITTIKALDIYELRNGVN